MVFVNPQEQTRKDRVTVIDDAVAVAAILGLIELGQGKIPIPVVRLRLLRKVAEQFLAIVDSAVSVAVQRQEGVSRTRCSPCYRNGIACSADIKQHSLLRGSKVKPFSGRVDDDWARTGIAIPSRTAACSGSVLACIAYIRGCRNV